jgi:putative transposase
MKQEILDTYQRTPYYGVRRMRKHLQRQGYTVGRKLVDRLYKELRLKALFPGPRTSMARKEHTHYPYLLKDLSITSPNHVWCSDITYIKLPGGHVYLVVIMDIYSRYIISWRLSNTMDAGFCTDALREGLRHATPRIFNTDQGSQYSSEEFTHMLDTAGIAISMDGKGRCFDNIMVERFWRTIKYELVYLYAFRTVTDLRVAIADYISFYNTERMHQSLEYHTPAEIYHMSHHTRTAA